MRPSSPLAAGGSTTLAAARKKTNRSSAAKRRPGLSSLAVARRDVLGARPLGMYYYSDDSHGAASVREYASRITLLAPQCFWIDKEGMVRGSIPAAALEAARRYRIPLMPLLYNRGFDRPTVTGMLRSAAAQDRALASMSYLAQQHNLVGFQIDLENIDPSDSALFIAFVRQAAARMHRDGRLLSVAVVPRFSDAPAQPLSGLPAADGGARPGALTSAPASDHLQAHTGEWAAPFDYRALGHAADLVVLMTYDHFNRNTAPGPIADHVWVKKALDYTVARIQPQKVLLGLPLYGREWIEAGRDASCRTLGFKDIQALLALPGLRPQWDASRRSPWLEFRDKAGIHALWFEDRRSLGDKLRLMREYRLRGFAAWRLGDDGPAFWSLTAKRRAKQANVAAVPGERRRQISKGGN